MSDPNHPLRRSGIIGESRTVTDPEELARSREQSREFRKTALYQIGPNVAEASPDLLAQYIALEMDADERLQFLAELLELLPADLLEGMDESLKRRLGRGAA